MGNREPVEPLEDWGDVVTGEEVGKEMGSRVLNALK